MAKKANRSDATIREYQRRERIAREALEFYSVDMTDINNASKPITKTTFADFHLTAQQALKQLSGEDTKL